MTTHSEKLTLSPTLLADLDFIADWEDILPLTEDFTVPIYIEKYVNAKDLTCPMPLLKLKMALKNTPIGNSVYVTATDPNSINDIGAFCRHFGYLLESVITENRQKKFHILVQKSV